MPLVCKMADNGRLTVVQKVKVELFYAETKSVVATQRRFRAHFDTRWAPCKQTVYRLSLGTIFQPIRINSVPDVRWFCNNKNVLCVESTVWHFVRRPVWYMLWYGIYLLQLGFHPVTVAGNFVQREERDSYVQKEAQYTKQYKNPENIKQKKNIRNKKIDTKRTLNNVTRVIRK